MDFSNAGPGGRPQTPSQFWKSLDTSLQTGGGLPSVSIRMIACVIPVPAVLVPGNLVCCPVVTSLV